MTRDDIKSCEYVVNSIRAGICVKCDHVGFPHEFSTDGIAYECPKCGLFVSHADQRAVKILKTSVVLLPEDYIARFEDCKDKLRQIALTGKIP